MASRTDARSNARLVRRELGEIVDAERPLQPSDAVDYHLETILAEFAMFVFFEIFGHRVEFVRRHDRAKLWKQNRVLARLVWPVHRNEQAHRIDERLPIVARGAALRRQL